ncbi:39S ribosomal protein L28, mitochondrial [Cephus cinctus]|uniref:Large ribosomal subunit protein bL28m n=1 Tax=Cephus cinctus TaxID=211228 RepID=A0AAJ7CEG3_CEPCN|nr:39S ribosomal protein L28, mitochondrial [Cephus cinctus]
MSALKLGKSLYHAPRPNRWQRGVGAELPDAYKKFWREWKVQKPAAVHYIEKDGLFERNKQTGDVYPVQNVPIPVKYPKEHNDGIWGGEGVIQGFEKRGLYDRRVPRFWVPRLKISVVYSEILNEYMRVTLTNRTLQLIHDNYGFDHYLLKTPACDLKSELALKIKRQILIALADKTMYQDDPLKQEEVYAKYQQYLSPFTREEIEWYGLNFMEACKKYLAIQAKLDEPKPLKIQYRSELISQLKAYGIEEAKNVDVMPSTKSQQSSWILKLNPFSKNPRAK